MATPSILGTFWGPFFGAMFYYKTWEEVIFCATCRLQTGLCPHTEDTATYVYLSFLGDKVQGLPGDNNRDENPLFGTFCEPTFRVA